jgi:hypothetical protein
MAGTTYIDLNQDRYDGNAQSVNGSISIGSLSAGLMTSIDNSIISVSVNYSMNEASQLSFEVLESMTVDYTRTSFAEKMFPRTLDYASNNYFQVGTDVVYETQSLNERIDTNNPSNSALVRQKQLFEIASVDFSQGPGGSPVWQVQCWTKAIQQMKRDRKPDPSSGTSSQYVRRAAEKYGLKFWGEETTKKVKINKATGGKQSDSLWTVLQRLAQEAKFVLFETDGYLIFASEKYLLHKWGIDSGDTVRIWNKKKQQFIVKPTKFIPLQYPYVTKGTPGYFFALSYPSINVSSNDPRYGSGSIVIDRTNGTQVRPGMTAYIGDVPGFNGYYLIETVTFNDRSPDPVSVSFRKPTREEKEQKEIPVGIRFLSTNATQAIPTRTQASVKPANIDARVFPLPTESNEYAYPRMATGIVATGNIPLYSRPVLVLEGEVGTTSAIVAYQRSNGTINSGKWEAGNTAVLIPTIWTVDGAANQLSAANSIQKYIDTGYNLGKFSSKEKALEYSKIIQQQQLQILIKRFPNVDPYAGGTYMNTAGST